MHRSRCAERQAAFPFFPPFPRYFNRRWGKLMVPTAIGHPWAVALWVMPSRPCHGDISHEFWLQGVAQFNPIFEWINIISLDELMALNVWGMNYAHIHLLPNVPHSWAESLLNQSWESQQILSFLKCWTDVPVDKWAFIYKSGLRSTLKVI